MNKELNLFMATHNTKCKNNLPDWIIPIQVGAHFNEDIFEKIVDNIGDNISYKNKQFCELTALYWIWKNNKDFNYIGLCHYRRHFNINKLDILKSLEVYDIILPNVRKLRISIEEQYIKEHCQEDWNTMIEVLKEIYPQYYNESKRIFSDNKMFCYNMFITNKNIFNEYCEWLFPLLFEIEKRIDISKRSDYQKRYIGFLSERLFTLYAYGSNLNILEVNINTIHNKSENNKFKNIVNNIIFKFKRRKEF